VNWITYSARLRPRETLCFGQWAVRLAFPKVHGAKMWRRFQTECARLRWRKVWLKALEAAGLFADFPNAMWEVVRRSLRPHATIGGCIKILKSLYPQGQLPMSLFDNAPFFALKKRSW
jgi:hypothetical protein